MDTGPHPSSTALDDTTTRTTHLPAQTYPAGTGLIPEPSSESPEPVTDAERATIVNRLEELGLSAEDSLDVSPREKELVNMILRLANDTSPDRSQLEYQAGVITSLMSQRDFLVRQAEEQRCRWESEADGWLRMAEVLIALRHNPGSQSANDEDLERQCASFEFDNRALREKLAETQTRLSSLETELAKLRPLLLMQSISATSPNLASTAPTPSKPKAVQVRKKKDKISSSTVVPDEQHIIDVEPDPVLEDTGNSPLAQNYYTKPDQQDTPKADDPQQRKRGIKRHKVPKTSTIPLSSDARAEHLLLAARRIGRQRMEMLASTRPGELKGFEDERRDSFGPSPKTPKRPLASLPPHAVPQSFDQALAMHGLNSFVFYNEPPRSSSSFPASPIPPHFLLPISRYPPMQTPAHRASFDRNATSTPETTPQTPLDSLLSAARSMMDGASTPRANGAGSSATADSTGKARRSGVVEMPESPIPPKRRKIAGGGVRGPAGLVRRTQSQAQLTLEPETPDGGAERRVKSALDVLADQAAVFSSGNRSGKGKERMGDIAQRSPGDKQTPHTGKPRMRKAAKEKAERAQKNDGSLGAEVGLETGTISHNAEQESRWQQVHKPPDDNDSGGLAGPSSRPWEREDIVSHSETSNSRAQLAESRPREDLDDQLQQMDQAVPEHLIPSLTTPLRSRAQTPSQPPTDQGSVQDDNRTPRSRSQNPGPATPEWSRSEDPREHAQAGDGSQRAASTPGATHHDVGQDIHSESGIQRGSQVEDAVESSLEKEDSEVVDSVRSDIIASGLVAADVESQEQPAWTPGLPAVDRAKIAGQEIQMSLPGKRPRSPYVKWSREEDELLAQAVAKYGQKWDQVQKALPSRGYHQVRQRWLRKLGVYDSKHDFTSSQSHFQGSSTGLGGAEPPSDTPPRLKLGMAPLSSEVALFGSRQPSGLGLNGQRSAR